MTHAWELMAAPRPMRPAGFTDPAFAALADLAHLLAGLVFPPNRQPSAEAGMRRAMSTLRIASPAALLRAAEAPGDARDVILAELTVGESYFFRDAAQLNILATDILPKRVGQYGAHRPLRMWSAGCASGEEAYTLAIMLREHEWPHPAKILGTDVALPRLRAARKAQYTRWALRGVSEARIARWFRINGKSMDLDATIRDAVVFRPLNLVHDDYASDEGGSAGYDLVLCRNVMIYFDLDTVARIATKLLATLHEDGWLVLGASDPPLTHLVPCEAVMTSAGMAYRRPGRAAAIARVVPRQPETIRWQPPAITPVTPRAVQPPVNIRIAAPAPPSSLGEDDIADAYARADYPSVELKAIVALEAAGTGSDTARLWILYIRAVANQGRLAEAGELCARALDTHPLDAELHYLHATLLAQAGWHADAATAARRAIYLDRDFVMAHLLLGDALTRTGETRGAVVAFRNTLVLLNGARPDATVRAADGVPPSRLRQIAELRLQAIGAGT
ncbi:MAG: methyltransferase, CheR-type [Gemmatimonadetes bacterium]|nr:methyltransferase, CheR-type [Gemmatimonadota bacterium]